MAGFVAGMMYVVACGTTGQSIAATIGNAIDVVFDNTTSGLTSTTVQGAIDEVNTKVETLESDGGTSNLLVGTWTGTSFGSYQDDADVTLALNADGTCTCTTTGVDFCNLPCDSWELIGDQVLKLYEDGSISARDILTILSVSSTNLILNRTGYDTILNLVKL